ncbi:MAG: DUF6128 domain-containing protein [Lachnospiraceae bacterium]|nr:DUF6128 domain-containing protein [Lachnospiraceae bacterium]
MKYFKKILYLSYMENEKKVSNCGNVKIEARGTRILLDMQINMKRYLQNGKFNATISLNDDSISLGLVYFKDGLLSFRKEFDNQFTYDDICDIKVNINEHKYIIGKIKECQPSRVVEVKKEQFDKAPQGKEWKFVNAPGEEASKPILEAAEHLSEEITPTPPRTPSHEDVRKTLHDIRMTPDKWHQLLKNYKQINPYADERLYLSLEPKDLTVLRSEYHQLVHNSFLLHGFYNYRHLILGKENEDYYLGVPGVFYEREKSVAMMFGFETFECEGQKPANGMFGYYLKKVGI